MKVPAAVWGYAAAGVVFVVIYQMIKHDAGKVADTAGGLLTGDNVLTKGTVYQKSGVVGTLGAGTNVLSGGVLESFGSYIGGKVFDWTHPEAGK